MDYRETTITVYGVTETVRTERVGRIRTDRQLETAHTKAVRAALNALHDANKADALAAAEKAARKAEAAARGHHSGVQYEAAREARQHANRIEKRKFTAPSCPDLKARLRPEPLRFDLTPDDPRFADIHEYFDPAAEAAAEAEAAAAPPVRSVQEWLDLFFDPATTLPA